MADTAAESGLTKKQFLSANERKYTQIKSNIFCSNGRVGTLFCPRGTARQYVGKKACLPYETIFILKMFLFAFICVYLRKNIFNVYDCPISVDSSQSQALFNTLPIGFLRSLAPIKKNIFCRKGSKEREKTIISL